MDCYIYSEMVIQSGNPQHKKKLLAPPEMNECPLKSNHFKRKIIFQPSFFTGYSLVFGGVSPRINGIEIELCVVGMSNGSAVNPRTIPESQHLSLRRQQF